MDVSSASGLRQLAAHILVEGGHHGVAGIVLQVRAVAHGDGCALGGTDAQDIDVDAALAGLLGSLFGSRLMVLAVGDDDDGSSHVLLLGKALPCHVDGLSDVGSLALDETRVGVLEEHLRRHIVARDGQLHESLSGEHHQSYLVVGEIVHEVLNEHLALVEPGGSHILGEHGVGDVEADDGLYALPLVVRHLASHLRTGEHHDEQGKCRQHETELHGGAVSGNVGHELLEKLGVAQFPQFVASSPPPQEPYQHQNGNHPQEQEKYRVFKS